MRFVFSVSRLQTRNFHAKFIKVVEFRSPAPHDRHMPASPKSPRALSAEREVQRKKLPQTAGFIENTEKVGWTFLTNHSHVIILLAQDPSMVLREVASRIGITERAVQRIIAELEQGGFIERQRVGRNNHYLIRTKKTLRHPIESHRTIGDLLNLLRGGRTTKN